MKSSNSKGGRQRGGSHGDLTILDNTVFYDRNSKNLRGYLVLHNKKVYEVAPIKIIVSKNLVELIRFEKPVVLGQPKYKKRLDKNLDDYPKLKAQKEVEKARRKEEYKRRSAIMAINNIKRIVDCNFTSKRSKFITLTFNNENNFDIRDLSQTHKEFKKFIQRLKRFYPKLKYVSVPEFQDKNGRGAVHYHMICNIPYTPKEKVAEIWRYGFIKIRDIKRVHSVGAYLAKYMSKDINDLRYGKNKKVLRSKYLNKPRVLYGKKAQEFIDKYNLNKTQPDYISRYLSTRNGRIIVGNYNLRKIDPAQNNKNAGK